MKKHQPNNNPVGKNDASSSEDFDAATRPQHQLQALKQVNQRLGNPRNSSTVDLTWCQLMLETLADPKRPDAKVTRKPR
jgi:hypothetical protein